MYKSNPPDNLCLQITDMLFVFTLHRTESRLNVGQYLLGFRVLFPSVCLELGDTLLQQFTASSLVVDAV